MNFSWQEFCDEYKIAYINVGKHSARGNIHIACPLCGDGSERMGLKLDRRQPYWGCWKDKAHAGRKPHRLITLLLGCSYKEAEAIVARGDTSGVDAYEAAIGRTLSPQQAPQAQQELEMPEEFHPLWDDAPGSGPFLDYLEDRGFERPEGVARRYDMHFAQVGVFAWRLIVPIYQGGVLVNWTARDVTGRAELRYRTLSEKPEAAKGQGGKVATLSLKSTVFNHDRAEKGGACLVICEGPFDAIKVEWLARLAKLKACAVAVFGMPTDRQVGMLQVLSRKFKRVLIALDSDAPAQSFRLVNTLSESCHGKPVSWARLPAGVKDPGALTLDTINHFL